MYFYLFFKDEYGRYLSFNTLGSYDQRPKLVSAHPRIPLWLEKSVMMWNSTFCKIIFPFIIVIFQTVSGGQRQTYNCHSSFQYLTLFHIITHFILSQIRKLYFDFCWCFDMFFIHQNVWTDLTYVWVQFKMNHLVFNNPFFHIFWLEWNFYLYVQI